MTEHESRLADAPTSQRDPERFAGGSGPVTEYVALPDEPTETFAIAGSANADLSFAEAGGFDSDD